MVLLWILGAAAPTDFVGRIGADVRAVSKSAAFIADVKLFLVKRAANKRCSVVHIAWDVIAIKNDDYIVCIAHTLCVEDARITRSDQLLNDVFRAFRGRDASDDSFRGVLRCCAIGACLIFLAPNAETGYCDVFFGSFFRWCTEDYDILLLVEAKIIFFLRCTFHICSTPNAVVDAICSVFGHVESASWSYNDPVVVDW